MDPQALQALLELIKAGDLAGAQAAVEATLAAEPVVESEVPPPAPAAEETPAALSDVPADDEEEVPAEPEALSQADRNELAAFRSERDAQAIAARKALVADLVSLGAETPATAFSKGALVARLASEPVVELRSRVAALRASRPTASATVTAPPVASGLPDLSEVEQEAAAKITDPARREQFIALRRSRKIAR